MAISATIGTVCMVVAATDNDLLGISPRYAEKVNRCTSCHPPCASSVVFSKQHLACTWCHRGNSKTSRKDIAHNFLIGGKYAWYRLPKSSALQEGEKLINRYACRRCHIQDNLGNRLATNLDQLLPVSSVEDIDMALRLPAFYMPNFYLDAGDRALLVTAIFAGGVAGKSPLFREPQVVHFADVDDSLDLWVKHCGSCHRLLTSSRGGIGSGMIGPNLSGLLTKFYPRTYSDPHGNEVGNTNHNWTAEALKGWVQNPRKTRFLARMPPIELSADELVKLIEEIAH